ncbi:MAG: hypothetical protein CM15mP42_07610 [Methanobacteriota archaeon]|jgi:hypothetical protein|nr:hypothetical protein [Euryarchaeota archaeon]MEC7698062.1 hypothetical protein [Candidatus Thermoplasmatota archaeon]GIR27811.1 MAG: hypothetical protein CM15mP42_07610 [Euryarchaeota archaeon]|tara:strand:+ start:4522 stop:4782 length:261 start_codon:yes stop_codon:yes gene_type:complete
MIDKNSEQYLKFEELWEGKTPKGVNINKKNSFRSRMKNSCHQEGLEFSKLNSFLVYSGLSKKLDDDTIIKNDIKVSNPPRRHLRNF